MGKPTSADTPNQANFQDNQNFDIDLNKIYNDWIIKIDSIRSIANTSFLLNNFKLLKPEDLTCFNGLTNPETTVQESRCHAFYRLIGLPILGADNRFFNPGFDIIINTEKKLKKSDKKAIILNPIAKFDELCRARETQSQDNAAIFSKRPVTIDASVLALSSGGTQELRTFIAPLEKQSDSLDADITHATYNVDLTARVGEYNVFLTEFKDSAGTKPTDNLKNLAKRSHIIAPFLVNGIIDFTVSPQSRLLAVPFIPNESYLKVNATEKVERPVLEKIIRDRFSTDNIDDAGTNIASIKSYIENFPVIKDSELIKLVTTKDIYQKTDSAKFIGNINTIRAMMKLLVRSENTIVQHQKEYYWLPAPSTTGPEGGSTVQKVFLFTQEEDLQLQTEFDKNILESSIKSAVSDQNSESATQLKFPVPTTDFGASSTSGLGDNNADNGETLSQTRERKLSKANAALRNVEVITGEFSGLGLCDIVAIISALNIMDREKLLGLLDDDAYLRMQTELKLTAESAPRSSVTASIEELNKLVKDYYNLMDQIYKNIKERQGIP